MKELVAALLPCVLIISFGILFIKIHKEIQTKKARKERLYYCQQRLHGVALQFRDDCMVATKHVLAQYTNFLKQKSFLHSLGYTGYYFLSDYCNTINNLKKEYLGNYAIKYSEGDNQLRIEAEDLPTYILDEYESEISEIANTFRDLSCYISDQIEELTEKNNKLT